MTPEIETVVVIVVVMAGTLAFVLAGDNLIDMLPDPVGPLIIYAPDPGLPGPDQDLCVLPLEFSDTPAPDGVSQTALDQRLFGHSTGTVWDYYQEVSYGSFDLQGEVLTDWLRSSRTKAYFGRDSSGVIDVGEDGVLNNVWDITTEAV